MENNDTRRKDLIVKPNVQSIDSPPGFSMTQPQIRQSDNNKAMVGEQPHFKNSNIYSGGLMVKPKRGRPRKNPNIGSSVQSTGSSPGFSMNQSHILQMETDEAMVGQAIHGVVDASFRDGFLISVKVENSDIMLRGVVFKAGGYVPVSVDNDVAPHLPLISRKVVHPHASASRGQSYTGGERRDGSDRTLVPVPGSSAQFASVPASSAQFASVPAFSAQFASVPASSAQFASVPASSAQFASVPASSAQFASVPASSAHFASVPASSAQLASVPAPAQLAVVPAHAQLAVLPAHAQLDAVPAQAQLAAVPAPAQLAAVSAPVQLAAVPAPAQLAAVSAPPDQPRQLGLPAHSTIPPHNVVPVVFQPIVHDGVLIQPVHQAIIWNHVVPVRRQPPHLRGPRSRGPTTVPCRWRLIFLKDNNLPEISFILQALENCC